MTPAQTKLLTEVRAAHPERHALRVCRGGFKTADVLIAAGVLIDATDPQKDCTRFVKLAGVA